jgi:hypothetical protein
MSNAALEAVIHEHCRELKLAAFLREYPALCRQAREGGGQPYEEFLRELLEAEVISRHNSTARRLLREARFPDIKTLDQVDWTALKGVSKPKILELASCQFITRAETAIVAGPIGTGKTMLAIALGVEATRRRFRVLFTRAAEPGAEPDRGPRRTHAHPPAAALREGRASDCVVMKGTGTSLTRGGTPVAVPVNVPTNPGPSKRMMIGRCHYDFRRRPGTAFLLAGCCARLTSPASSSFAGSFIC